MATLTNTDMPFVVLGGRWRCHRCGPDKLKDLASDWMAVAVCVSKTRQLLYKIELFCNEAKWTEFLKRFRNLGFLYFPNYGFPTTQRLHLRFFCILAFGHNPIVLICIFLLPLLEGLPSYAETA